MNWTLICRGKAGLCFPDLYLPTLPLFSNKLDSSLVRINPALLLLNIMSHLGEAPSDICRFLELSFAAMNYRPSTEKHSPMRKPGWPPVFMPMLVRISPGDKILSGTEILIKKQQRHREWPWTTAQTLMQRRQALDDKPRDGLMRPGMSIRQTIQVIRPQNW